MSTSKNPPREGSLDAPTRNPINWEEEEFFNEANLTDELDRVLDICHGCRRCFNLCNDFPTLFDAVDGSETGEVDSVPKEIYWDVIDHCYLCDMCYMSKCPYVPPHEWAVDFPHLMLRAKSKKFKEGKTKYRDKILSSTDMVGKFAGIPIVKESVNTFNKSKLGRKILQSSLGVHEKAPIPKYHSHTAQKKLVKKIEQSKIRGEESITTNGKVVLFTTCYGNYNHPKMVEDLVSVFQHNSIELKLVDKEVCCGMPKLELGDLESVKQMKDKNIDKLYNLIKGGWDITAPIPSCVLMFKQELPLLFPKDEKVLAVSKAFYDPFEYLMLRHKAGMLVTDFENSLGKISYQVPCHLRVQNIGLKTRDLLELVPDTSVDAIERCSGHDGTYAVKKEFNEASRKIARPVVRRVSDSKSDEFTSDCPMAAEQIASLDNEIEPKHPIQLLRYAYGI